MGETCFDILRTQQTRVLTLDVAASKWDLAARRAVGDWRVITAPHVEMCKLLFSALHPS